MSDQREVAGARHSPWEYVAWCCFAAIGVVLIVASTTTEQALKGVFAFAATICGAAWSWYVHRNRPEQLGGPRRSIALQAIAGAIMLTLCAVAIALANEVEAKLVAGLFAAAVIAMIVAERTRELPKGEVSRSGQPE